VGIRPTSGNVLGGIRPTSGILLGGIFRNLLPKNA